MMFVPSVRADEARPEVFARALRARAPKFAARLTISVKTIGFLANHNFRPIERYHFAMRCFQRPLGGPRQANTRGGES